MLSPKPPKGLSAKAAARFIPYGVRAAAATVIQFPNRYELPDLRFSRWSVEDDSSAVYQYLALAAQSDEESSRLVERQNVCLVSLVPLSVIQFFSWTGPPTWSIDRAPELRCWSDGESIGGVSGQDIHWYQANDVIAQLGRRTSAYCFYHICGS